MNFDLAALIEKGREQLAQGNYSGAVDTFQRSLTLNPEDVWVLTHLGFSWFKQRNYSEALKYLNQALAIQKDYIPALRKRIFVYHQMKEHEKNDLKKADIERIVKADAEQIIAIPAQDAEDWKGKGTGFFELEKYEDALQSQEQAIALDANDYEAWLYRGIILSKLKKFPAALNSFDRSTELNPHAHENWLYRGITLSHMASEGSKQAAIESFDQAIAMQPDDGRPWFYRGATWKSLKEWNKALQDFDRAIEIDPSAEKFWDRRFTCLDEPIKRRDQSATICRSWKRILPFKPNDVNALYYYGSALIGIKDFQQALQVFEQAIRIDPSSAKTWLSKGKTLGHMGRYEEAIASYNHALEVDPHNADIWYERGKALAQLGRERDQPAYSQEALDCYNEALKLDRSHIPVWNAKGNILVNLSRPGSFQEGIKAYRKALHLSNNQFWLSWKNLGTAYSQSSGYQKAIKTWEEGYNHLQPRSLDYQEGCGTLQHVIGQTYYREGLKGNRSLWSKAKEHYERAIGFLEKSPNYRKQVLEVLQDLYAVYLGLEETEKAEEVQRQSRDQLDRLLGECQNPLQKQQLALRFAGLKQLTVNCYVQSGQLIKALETAEEGKNTCLTWLLSGWSEQVPTCKWREILTFLGNETAIVYWHLSPVAMTTFVIKPNCTTPILVKPSPLSEQSEDIPAAVQHLKNLEDWIANWNQLYERDRKHHSSAGSSRSAWYDRLPDLLDELGQILDLSAILSHIEGVNRIILIPHGDLHRLPLHALFPSHLTISYLPSIQTGMNLGQRKFCLEGKLLSVGYPNSSKFSSLPAAEVESAAIVRMLPMLTPKQISDAQATKEAVVDALKDQYTFFHFTGHGFHEFHDPQKSALILTGEEKLTLKEILKISFREYYIVSLSACETAMTGKQTITEEYVGLVSAFLHQRASYVVSTLWTVTDDASSLFMVYFYWQLTKGRSPTDALSAASKWLRTLTDSRLERLYRLISNKLPKDKQLSKDERLLQRHLKRNIQRIRTQTKAQKTQKRFDHPYYYCAFTITGQ